VNTFFGSGETLDNLKNSAKASLNIVVSDTFGVEAAKAFEEVHNVPYISVPFPIGVEATSTFLYQVAFALGIEKSFIDRVIEDEKKYFYEFYERLSDIYNDIDLQRYAVIAADSNYATALTEFLANDLGWLPELVVITDFLNEKEQAKVIERFKKLPYDVRPKVVFDTDTSSVKRHLSEHWPSNGGQRYYDNLSPAFVLGSAFERDLAEEIGAPHLSVTYPISNRVVLDRAYAGFKGALSLTEDILSVLVGSR
jgi:nitrogenase molybdenum-iron protein beta chain